MNATSKTQPSKTDPDLQLAFDVGHSSIGWAVLNKQGPNLLGCGAVIFPADDCLASQRRAFRRQRRHIRATRLRIARIKRLLAHLGVLTVEQLDKAVRLVRGCLPHACCVAERNSHGQNCGM